MTDSLGHTPDWHRASWWRLTRQMSPVQIGKMYKYHPPLCFCACLIRQDLHQVRESYRTLELEMVETCYFCSKYDKCANLTVPLFPWFGVFPDTYGSWASVEVTLNFKSIRINPRFCAFSSTFCR